MNNYQYINKDLKEIREFVLSHPFETNDPYANFVIRLAKRKDKELKEIEKLLIGKRDCLNGNYNPRVKFKSRFSRFLKWMFPKRISISQLDFMRTPLPPPPKQMTSGYLQVVEQTHEEKVEMYMKSSKEDLIKMLIECNRCLDVIGPTVVINEQTVSKKETVQN